MITGNDYVPDGGWVAVYGNLTLAPGACLDAFSTGTVNVSGNVLVGPGATLALGCSPGAAGPFPPCDYYTTHDVVGGSIIASAPRTMYLTAVTVYGSVISNGGGPGPDSEVNFPVKENFIAHNLTIQGWNGFWMGALRNVVNGSMVISGNAGSNPDSTEIANNLVGGNLICVGNTPAAQLGDSGGGPNTVNGRSFGECAGLSVR